MLTQVPVVNPTAADDLAVKNSTQISVVHRIKEEVTTRREATVPSEAQFKLALPTIFIRILAPKYQQVPLAIMAVTIFESKPALVPSETIVKTRRRRHHRALMQIMTSRRCSRGALTGMDSWVQARRCPQARRITICPGSVPTIFPSFKFHAVKSMPLSSQVSYYQLIINSLNFCSSHELMLHDGTQ